MTQTRLRTPEGPAGGDESLLEAIFARLSPSPVAVLQAALRFTASQPGAIPPEMISNALERRGEQRAASWLKNIGPTVGIQDVVRQTALSKSGVHKAKEDARVLAFRLPGQNFDRFPLFQFQGGKVRGWIPELLARTGNGLAAVHFLCVNRRRLQNRAYIDLLRDKDDPAVVAKMLRHADGIGDAARGPDSARAPSPYHA